MTSFLLILPAAAQTSGTLRGSVKDPSDAVVPNAQVTATQQATKVTRSSSTDAAGGFVFPVLPVGTYDLAVEAAGFKKYQQKDINIDIGRVAIVEVKLTVGATSEVVEVGAAPPLVETASTQLGAVVNDRAVSGLPLNARDTYQLLQIQPGVQSQIGQALFFGSDRAGVVAVNGGRGRSNNFNVNGGEGNDLFANLPAVQPAPDTIEEFRVLTNTFDAEHGRNSGAVVNVVTKSGSNQFHGNVYEFFRNKVLNAKGFLDPEKSDFKQNQFGGTFGGPIRKDKTFFFGSYEGRRIRQGISSGTILVPTAAERTGDFSAGTPFAGFLTDQNVADILNAVPGVPSPRIGCAAAIAANGGTMPAAGVAYAAIFPGNVIPTACFDPTAADLLDPTVIPLGNVGDGVFQAVPGSADNSDQFTVHLDHKISQNHQLNAYYYFTDRRAISPFASFQGSGASLPGFGSSFEERIQQANVAHTWVINPTTVNEFRFTYFREAQSGFNHPLRTSLVQDSCPTLSSTLCFSDPVDPTRGITPGLDASREGLPFIDVGIFSIGNNLNGELPQKGNTFHWSDSFSKVVGKHSLKFGADVRRQRFDQFLVFDVNGSYSFTSDPTITAPTLGNNDVGFDTALPNFLLGLPDDYLQGSAQFEHVRSTSVYLFGQDSWKIKDNLTLNYGLRWELNTPIADVGQRVQTFRPGQATQIYPCQIPEFLSDGVTPNPAFATFGGIVGTPLDCNPGDPAEAAFPLGLVVPGDAGVPNGLTQTYFRSFAPRIGLAWSPDARDGWLARLTGGPGKTSIRMGWGMFYNPVEQLVLEQFSAEPPFGGSSFFARPLFNTPFVPQAGGQNPNPFNGVLDPPRGSAQDWSRFRPILLFGQFLPDLRSQYSVQYNLTIQREITKDLLFQIGYVGTQGHRLLATHDLNFGNPQTCLDLQALVDTGNPAYVGLDCGQFGADNAYGFTLQTGDTLTLPNGSVVTGGAGGTNIALVGLRPFSSPLCDPLNGWDGANFINGCPPDAIPVFSSIFAQDTIAHSNYHSLQALLEKRFSHGLQFSGAYTWSKSIDNASSFENILNPFNFRSSRALSLFHAAHRFVFSYVWELPIPKYSGAKSKLLNGWAVSGITTFQTGFPIRILSDEDRELQFSVDFELPGRPDLVGPFRTMDPRTNPTNQFFDPAAFAPQALGTLGTAPRTICCGPSINNWDFAVHKNTPLNESMRLEFRAEFFNIWNHTQFFNPDGDISDGDLFGTVTKAKDPRLIQFALKVFF